MPVAGRQLDQFRGDGRVTLQPFGNSLVPSRLLMSAVDLVGQHLHAQRALRVERFSAVQPLRPWPVPVR